MALRSDITALAPDVLTLLPLPDLADLPEPQFRGTACVWGGGPVDTVTAVDLGQRRIDCADGYITASPRACRRCAGEKAYGALFDHAPSCEQCVDNAAECEIGRALNRLVREGPRSGTGRLERAGGEVA